MIKALLRKIIYVIVLLWVISLIAFWLSKQVPGDEVMDYISIDAGNYTTTIDPVQFRNIYQRVAQRRGLDLPEFYFSIRPAFIPDSVQFILPKDDRNIVKQWIHVSGNGPAAMALYHQLKTGLIQHCGRHISLCQFYNQSLSTPDIRTIRANATALRNDPTTNAIGYAEARIDSVINLSENILQTSSATAGNKLFPVFEWNGADNQYHQWMKGLLLQKPLTSLVDGRNAWSKMYDALKWTLLLNGFALIISILAGVFVGIWSSRHEGQHSERTVNWILFALFALPSFWLGTLFIYFFASGEWLSIFPSGGLGPYHSTENIVKQWTIIGSHLFLPVMCLALGSLAYVSRQMKQSVLHEYTLPYVSMLRAQGISEKTILRKHVTGNALFPIITMVGGAVPALLSGSLIIEVIFSIPGMGRLMFDSLMSRDWPVAFPILMLGAVITILSYILTDVLYKWADPRVKVLQT